MKSLNTITIELKQKSMFPKTIDINTILDNHLQYGSYQGNHLVLNTTNKEGITTFIPNKWGRGIEVLWNEDEEKNILVQLSLPTCNDEIKELIHMVLRIMNVWIGSISYNHEYLTRSGLKDLEQEFYKMNIQVLQEICDDAISFNKIFKLKCAMHNLYFGKKEADFIQQGDMFDTYSEWLSSMQSKAVFIPDLVKNDEDEFEIYIPTALPCLLPFNDKLFFVDNNITFPVNVILYDSQNKIAVDKVLYANFLNYLPKEKLSYYDAQNFWLRAIYKEEYTLLFHGKELIE